MSTSISPMPNTQKCVKTGLGGAVNFHQIVPVMSSSSPNLVSKKRNAPITFTTGIGGAGNTHSASEISLIPQNETLIQGQCPSLNVFYYGISGAGNHTNIFSPTRSPRAPFRKLKTNLQSQIEVRNSRTSIFEAWQSKLPSAPQPVGKAYSSGLDRCKNKNKNKKSSSAASYSSDADTLTGRVENLKERLFWRAGRIASRGLDEGTISASPLYMKL